MRIKEFFNKNKSLIFVFILFLIAISIMQFRTNEIIGYDGWLHMKMADIIKEKGFIQEFPYTTESILSQSYSDPQLLFRILLIPFTYFGLILGAKIASILFASLCFTVFYWYMKKNELPFPLLWTFLYAFCSIELMYRFLETRAMPLAIISLLLTLYFMDKQMYRHLFFTSLLFAWLYQGFIFQILIVIIYFLIKLIALRRLDLKLLAYSLGGTLLAVIVNPYFPKNIGFLYTQLFKVNLIGNLYNMEWKPWNILDLFKFNWIILIVLLASLFLIIKDRKFGKRHLLTGIASIIFLILMINSRRMQEYFVPFTLIFGAFSLKSHMNDLSKKEETKYILLLTIGLIAGFNLFYLDLDIKNNNFLPWYHEGAEWSINNIPDGSKIFINGYMFNYLFFYNPDLRYTHGIDLTYSYLYNPANFNRYMEVLQGKDPGYNIIKDDYKSDYTIVGKVKQDIKLYEYIIKYKKDFEVVYEDDSIGILKVNKQSTILANSI
ncbi:MAG: hypothetical protein KKC75_07355 [Nanoarchaeota archaeon]|nr:hypothetical protein [Nanoarchaeota archaeon]MBU1004539.1 hypothetical protein [Nanoarchaeota archaeon]MBU1945924.1 hypothetical protein [Nanoarchaeota archaeon]